MSSENKKLTNVERAVRFKDSIVNVASRTRDTFKNGFPDIKLETIDDRECICDSNALTLANRYMFLKKIIYYIIILGIIVLVGMGIAFAAGAKISPLYDPGFSRRNVEFDGSGTMPSFNERMQFSQQYMPDNSE